MAFSAPASGPGARSSGQQPTMTLPKPDSHISKKRNKSGKRRNTNTTPAFLSVAPSRSFDINDFEHQDGDENHSQLAKIDSVDDDSESEESSEESSSEGDGSSEGEGSPSEDDNSVSDESNTRVESKDTKGTTDRSTKGKGKTRNRHPDSDEEQAEVEDVWTTQQERVEPGGSVRAQARQVASDGTGNGNTAKDEEEVELEALVFGNSGGFRESIQRFAAQQRDADKWHDGESGGHLSESDAAGEEGSDVENIGDDDLFFVDAQGDHAVAGQKNVGKTQEEQSEAEEDEGDGNAAWEDSDDGRIEISLASVGRLRKLRVTEDEDVVDGKEYIRRLRRQYLKMHPTPQWVEDAIEMRRGRKRRKTSDGEELTDSSDSDVEMEGTETFSGHRPLADLLRDASSLTRTASIKGKRKLRPEVIDIQRTKHIANEGPSAITSLQIHPSLPLLLASGPSSRMDLYHLHDTAPTYTTHLTSLFMKAHPFTTTAFHPLASDARIFLSARRRYYHVWNLASGQIETITRMYGHSDEQRSMESFKISPTGAYIAFIGSARKGGGVINFVDASTLQWTAQARIESRGGIADFAWWRDGNGVVIAGKNGEVSEFDLGLRRVVARWTDEGAVGTTTVALGGKSKSAKSVGGDAYIAIGSSAGIVNIYSRANWFKSSNASHVPGTDGTKAPKKKKKQNKQQDEKTKPTINNDDDDENAGIPASPTPLRALTHLTTPVSHLTFSPDGQVLCMASRWKKDALRLVHLPSCTVYRNWPTSNTPLGRISAVCWGVVKREGEGEGEGVLKLIVGNESGRVAGWEVRGD